MLASLRLLKNEDRRLRAGHGWVFSNEIDNRATPLNQFEPGQAVVIEDHRGQAIGSGYVNPHALICARLVTRDTTYSLDQSLLVHRLNVALSLRERLYDAPYYRLAYGDSDALPGLVIDRYGDVLVAQITTAGMERVKNEIVGALQKVLSPKAVLFRNDAGVREMEGLPLYTETAFGDVPERVALEENGVRFEANPVKGQKTGWFYDHRPNRIRLGRYARGKRVLDLFSYLGGWGIQAAHAGAESVLCVDSSADAIEGIARNAALNNLSDKVTMQRADAFDALRALREQRERFDVVVLDPPAFIKRKKDIKEGSQAYQRINQMAMQVLAKDGMLVSCSCSYHLTQETLMSVLLKTSRHLDRFIQIVEQGHQGPDHPIHPAMPETAYIKAFFARILPS